MEVGMFLAFILPVIVCWLVLTAGLYFLIGDRP